MNRFVLRQSLLLLLCATIWGSGFVAQSVGMDYVEPFTFLGVRSLIAVGVLFPYIKGRDYLRKKKGEVSLPSESNPKILIRGGICCGIALTIASAFQQFGIKYTTVGKAGFITAMYIILVPIVGIFLKKRVGIRIWISVMIAVIGLYLLCMKQNLHLEMGDALVFVCAFCYTIHILVVDYFTPLADGVKISCIQFAVCGVLSSICMFLFEKPDIMLILQAWEPILYAGALSSGIGYTLQIVGQKGMNPTVASLIMSLESVISAIAGFLVLHQNMTLREILGCTIMFGAIVLAQLPNRPVKQSISI